MISAYHRPGTVHTFLYTTDVIAAMEQVLGLDSLSKFDHYARSMRSVFAATPDLAPYNALVPSVDMEEKNPEGPRMGRFDFSREDANDDEAFNRELWAAVKGDAPYPGARRAAMGSVR